MQPVVLLYPPFKLIGQPAPGTEWPPPSDVLEVRFLGLATIMAMTMPGPQGAPMPVIQVSGLGDWTLRNGSWAGAQEPSEDEKRAYVQWRAAQSGIQLADGSDPLLKGSGPQRGLRRVR